MQLQMKRMLRAIETYWGLGPKSELGAELRGGPCSAAAPVSAIPCKQTQVTTRGHSDVLYVRCIGTACKVWLRQKQQPKKGPPAAQLSSSHLQLSNDCDNQ